MFGKTRTLVVAVAAAGLVGSWAPLAHAATADGPGDNSGLIGISHNQIPIQVCDVTVPVNALGVQLPLDGVAAALGLLNHGYSSAKVDKSCHQNSGQLNTGDMHMSHWQRGEDCAACAERAYNPAARDLAAVRPVREQAATDPADGPWGGGGDNDGLIGISHNQIPIQVCDVTVPVNVLGIQVPVTNAAAALGLLSSGSNRARVNTSCRQNSGQIN